MQPEVVVQDAKPQEMPVIVVMPATRSATPTSWNLPR